MSLQACPHTYNNLHINSVQVTVYRQQGAYQQHPPNNGHLGCCLYQQKGSAFICLFWFFFKLPYRRNGFFLNNTYLWVFLAARGFSCSFGEQGFLIAVGSLVGSVTSGLSVDSKTLNHQGSPQGKGF